MRGKITKQITLTAVNAVKVDVKEGVPTLVEVPAIDLLGEVNERAALRAIKEEYGNGTYSIVSIAHNRKAYEMDVETFMEHATEISPEQAKKNNA